MQKIALLSDIHGNLPALERVVADLQRRGVERVLNLGDHGFFLMNQIPALAITSELLTELMAEITHTPKDRPEIVELAKLAKVALALRDVLLHLNQTPQ